MPVVLTVSGSTESGHIYDDNLGEHYTFPEMYRRLIKPGETGVFYTGRRAYPGKTPLSYLGVAIIGDIAEVHNSYEERRLFRCNFRRYQEFQISVPFKRNEHYVESGANSHKRPPLYFSRGVRALSLENFDTILSTAEELASR